MVVHSYYPVGEVRGEKEAHAAVKAGFRVTVVCLGRAGEPLSETVDGVDIVRISIEHARGVSALRTIVEYTAFALSAAVAVLRVHWRRRIDIAYIHAPPDFLIVAALIPRLLGKRVVIDIHDLSPHMFDARFGNRRLSRLVERALYGVERVACRIADAVVTVHDPYRDELTAHGVPRDKITVVMNAPPAEPIAAARNAATNEGPREGFVVAYHGTVTYWYGVDLLIEAVARLQDRVPLLRGVILGEGDALPEIEALAERLGVASRIEFPTQLLAQHEAVARVASASCGVIPNRNSRLNRFALSSKLLEYVALGIPVVVSHLDTLAAHFGPDEVTFFEPGDAASLAQAIAWVAQNPNEALDKAVRAQHRAEAYSWAASSARLLATLSDDRSANPPELPRTAR
jgi:glycosyltransferase involved in cell wall biosynthesis